MQPTLDSINATAERLQDYVIRTPTLPYYGLDGAEKFGNTNFYSQHVTFVLVLLEQEVSPSTT